jgi:hypothetical protein
MHLLAYYLLGRGKEEIGRALKELRSWRWKGCAGGATGDDAARQAGDEAMKQTRARIFRSNTRGEGKLLSLFEPSTEVICKGKARPPRLVAADAPFYSNKNATVSASCGHTSGRCSAGKRKTDGLKAYRAAANDGSVTMKTWVHYAQKRVPESHHGLVRDLAFSPDERTSCVRQLGRLRPHLGLDIRLSSDVANPLSRSRNYQADGDGCSRV